MAAATVGLLYLIGFLVVAGHLSRYGVSSFSVLQLQYLIAGVWVLGPPIIWATIRHTEQKFEESTAPDIPGKFNWRRFLVSTLIAGIPSAVFFVLLASIPGILASMTWGIGIQLYLFFVAMLNCAYFFWKSWRSEEKQETRWINRHRAAPFYLTLLLTIVLGYVVWFSARIYPLIPFSLGGGRPLTVAFMEGEKKLPDGIKPDTSSTRSIPYKLLVATDKYYVVLSPDRNEKSIEISRDSVAGMVVLEEPHAP